MFSCSAFFLYPIEAKQLALDIVADSAILINADTGAIIFEKNAHKLQYPASITKIATTLYALHLIDNKLDTIVVADQDAIASVSEEKKRKSNYTLPAYWLVPEATHIGIKKGEALTLKDLLYAIMVSSANDASNVVAHHLGGTVPKYMEGLNKFLKKIGCKKTQFLNPHGLHHPKHQTTAYDMAIIMKEALKNHLFCEMIKTTRYIRPKTDKQESSVLIQTNRMIRPGKNFYPHAIGGKTGYIAAASHTLVVAAKKDGRTLIAVLMKSKEKNEEFRDAAKMFEAAFNQPKVQRLLFKAGPQQFKNDVPTYLKEDVSIEYYPAEEPNLKCFLNWITTKTSIVKDQKVGELNLQTEDGKTLYSIPLFAQEDGSSALLNKFWQVISSVKAPRT